MSQVSVVIVNWNGKHLLQRCLPALQAQDFQDYEIVVVDNGSQDGSGDWLAAVHPAVRLLRNERNLGFAAGNNRAIRETSSPYVATLNNDALPAVGWLRALAAAMDAFSEAGMCASKMVRADDPACIDSCGIEVDRAGIAWDRRAGERDEGADDSPYSIFGPCAGAALYRRAMLDQVGLFDEDYFAYYEDVDLAWRAQRAGWRCLYVPAARVTHDHSGTAREGSPFKGYHLGRNKWWTLIKNYPWPGWLWRLPLILGCDVAAWGYALLQGDLHPLRGRLAALRAWPAMADKRRAIQRAGQAVPLAPVQDPLRRLRAHRRLQGREAA